MSKSYEVWNVHIYTIHTEPPPPPPPNSKILRDNTKPQYIKNTYMVSALENLNETLYSFLDSDASYQGNDPMLQKYEQICDYYFQARYNTLFKDEDINSVRSALVKQTPLHNRMFGPLPTHSTLLEYKGIFKLWIVTIMKLKTFFTIHSSLQDWFDELKDVVELFVTMPPDNLVSQEQAFSEVKDIPKEFRDKLGDGGEIDNPKFIIKTHPYEDENLPYHGPRNVFRRLAEGYAMPWPGADAFEGLQNSLQCFHNFLINIIIDVDSSGLIFIALALMLLDSHEGDVQTWKPAEEVNKIVNGLLYALRLIIHTQFEILCANPPAGFEPNDSKEFLKYFLDPATGTFVQPLYSLNDSINRELRI